MKISGVTKKAFLVGLGFGLVGATTTGASAAWTRTMAYMQHFVGVDNAVELPFPSDGINTTPNGNSATTIFGDYYWIGLAAGKSLTVNLQACGVCFNNSCGSCGTPASNTYTTSTGNADITIPKWTGSGSNWDYFWVTAYLAATTGTPTVYFMGIGVTGT